jgi:hypothetical protein
MAGAAFLHLPHVNSAPDPATVPPQSGGVQQGLKRSTPLKVP